MSAAVLERAAPVYETFEGWKQDLRGCRSVDELPAAARRYVAAIEQRAGVPISHISVGPERTQTIAVDGRPLAAANAARRSAMKRTGRWRGRPTARAVLEIRGREPALTRSSPRRAIR